MQSAAASATMEATASSLVATVPSSVVSGAATERPRLVGNRLALAGVIIYFLEWVGIIGFSFGNIPASQGTPAAEVFAQYAQHGTGIQLLAGWLSVVLLGRVLFVAGIRDSLRRSGAQTLLADFAMVAMGASVILEIAAFAVAAGGAYAATNGADQSTIVGIDGVANYVDLIIAAPFGVAAVAASSAMLQSRLFPALLCWLGLVAGVAACAYGVVSGAAFAAGGTCAAALCTTGSFIPGLAQALSIALLVAWIWMIATGAILFRADVANAPDRPRGSAQHDDLSARGQQDRQRPEGGRSLGTQRNAMERGVSLIVARRLIGMPDEAIHLHAQHHQSDDEEMLDQHQRRPRGGKDVAEARVLGVDDEEIGAGDREQGDREDDGTGRPAVRSTASAADLGRALERSAEGTAAPRARGCRRTPAAITNASACAATRPVSMRNVHAPCLTGPRRGSRRTNTDFEALSGRDRKCCERTPRRTARAIRREVWGINGPAG